MKYSKTDISDSKTSEETVYIYEHINPVTHIPFSDTDVILESAPDSPENNKLPFAPHVSGSKKSL